MSYLMKSGPYVIEVTERPTARRMILHAKTDRDYFTLSVPAGIPKGEITRFLTAQQPWMASQRQKAEKVFTPKYEKGERHRLLGQWITLGENGVPCGGDAYYYYEAEQLKNEIFRLHEKWRSIFPLVPTHFTFQEMSSRWGSARKTTRRLTFNTKLARLDPIQIEYVYVHELCHFIEANHSAAFYALLDRYLPGHREIEKSIGKTDITPKPPLR